MSLNVLSISILAFLVGFWTRLTVTFGGSGGTIGIPCMRTDTTPLELFLESKPPAGYYKLLPFTIWCDLRIDFGLN